MRFLLLVLILVCSAPTVRAQSEAVPTPAQQPGITDGEEAVLFGTAALAAAGNAYVLIRATEWVDGPSPLYALPFVPIAATCAVGAALRLGGSCLQAFRSGLMWSLPGYALMTVGIDRGIFDDLGAGALLVGGLWLILAPPLTAIESYRRSTMRATPTVLSDPATHEFVPGMRFTVDF